MHHKMQNPNPPDTLILRGEEARLKVESLGLRTEWLQRAVRRGVLAQRDASGRYAPPVLGPVNGWGHCAIALREAACEHGWRSDDWRGIAVTVSPVHTVAVTGLAGCGFTGMADRSPSTKAERGRAWDGILETVSTNYDLFRPAVAVRPIDECPERLDTLLWVLLFHFRMEEGRLVVRSELSLPRAKNEYRVIDQWWVRAILPTIDTNPGLLRANDETPDPVTSGPEISVTRKSA